jgi:hypothetical protein
LNIYPNKENLWDFEKIGIIFGSAIVNINFSGEILFDEIFSLKELSVWSKYVSGCAFSIINSKKKNFNRWFWQSIYNDSISDHIKGGIVFGLSLGLKNNYEIERHFYKECEGILKSTQTFQFLKKCRFGRFYLDYRLFREIFCAQFSYLR